MTKPPFSGPTSLHGAPAIGGGSYYERVQHTQVIPAVPPAPVRPPRPVVPAPPLLTLAWPNLCTLSKPLLAAVPHLKLGGRVLLVPPVRRGGPWFLNTRPAPGMGSKLPERGVAMFRTHPIARNHFISPKPTLVNTGGRCALSAVGNENVFATAIHFQLGKEVQGHAGLYELLPFRRP